MSTQPKNISRQAVGGSQLEALWNMPASWNDPQIAAERKRKAKLAAKAKAKTKAKPAAAGAELAGVELADVELADVELPEVEPAPAPGPAAALSAVGGRAVISCLGLLLVTFSLFVFILRRSDLQSSESLSYILFAIVAIFAALLAFFLILAFFVAIAGSIR